MSEKTEHTRRAEMALALATALSLPLIAGSAWAQEGNSRGNEDIQVNEYTQDSTVPYRTRKNGEIVTLPGVAKGATRGRND